MKDAINIVFGFDQKYSMPCGVTMLSICINTPGPICFHAIIDKDVTDETRDILTGIASSYGNKVIFYVVDISQFSGLPSFLHISRSTYIRFLIPEILPPEVEKVLYLDTDLVAIKSLEPLWEMNLGQDEPAAMAFDMAGSDVIVHNVIETPMSQPYCNAGVMLINLDCWRREGIGRTCLEAVMKNRYPFMDQDALNAVIGSRIRRIHLKYNMQVAFKRRPESKWTIEKKYFAEAREAILDPVIIHYSEPDKPWVKNNGYSEEWIRFKSMSPWKDEPLQDRFLKLEEIWKKDKEAFDSTATPLLAISVGMAGRYPRLFSFFRKALWNLAKKLKVVQA